MHRRDLLRKLILGPVAAGVWPGCTKADRREDPRDSATHFISKWHLLPDMTWTGEDLWAQRLQDWQIRGGKLRCLSQGNDRTVHVLTHQVADGSKPLRLVVDLSFATNPADLASGFAGLRIGVKGRIADYRAAIMRGVGTDLGIRNDGRLFIDGTIGDEPIDSNILSDFVRLSVDWSPSSATNGEVKLSAYDASGNVLASVTTSVGDATMWQGNIAVVSHFASASVNDDTPTVTVHRLEIEGDGLSYVPEQVYGPVYFAQYTVHAGVLKLSAQLAPVEPVATACSLYFRRGGEWSRWATSVMHPMARVSTFRVEGWNASQTVDYKVVLELPLTNGEVREYSYEGTIAANPESKSKVKALAFSCNWDLGFPDSEVVENALKHEADMVFFLGDQFYESNGRFGVQTAPLEKATLDYLRKWYQFGWSYRDLFRRVPMIALPDDHDVYHGNIWGAGGRATIAVGTDDERQDSGGYKMPAGWVNMAQITQTSHMPDPFDPTPVQQDISVFYTNWEYGGVSFGIVEDRKFKSAPKDILPPEARPFNGFAQNPDFDRSKVKTLQAQLLGERQVQFLKTWTDTCAEKSSFMILVSATPFCCLQTLPKGTTNDDITPELAIPEPGEYVQGDDLTMDMDTNGWPQICRDRVLRLIRDKVDLHLCGDQHLAAIVQYGVDEYGDSPFCFTVPALNNIWPRRWWPPLKPDHKPLPGRAPFTGEFKDGFGNRMTVYAAANPRKTGKEPALLYDRSTGYGLLEFDKSEKKIIVNCFPRYEHRQQYEGWPFTVLREKA